jgi:hypothetical protein
MSPSHRATNKATLNRRAKAGNDYARQLFSKVSDEVGPDALTPDALTPDVLTEAPWGRLRGRS